MKKRVLLMYISENSGHHQASRAIENALHQLSDDVETFNIDSFHYTNPILEKIVNQAYMSVIKRKPEFWGQIYDNPKIVKNTQRLRASIHKYNSNKMTNLLDELHPQAILCTQAFPCGIIADCKNESNADFMLAGVLTDYAPHSYWIYDNVDTYFVPSTETGEKLIMNGVLKEKINVTGIPIDPKFRKVTDKKKVKKALNLLDSKPIVLVMGGSQGIGPIKEIMKFLNVSEVDFQIIVITGNNKKLFKFLEKKALHSRKKTVVLGYVKNIDEIMEISSIVISKPGGITISESLAKGLPVFIVKPIPGQEEMNAGHLVKNKVAVRLDNFSNINIFLKELFSSLPVLNNMRQRAKAFSKPNSAIDIAKSVLERIM